MSWHVGDRCEDQFEVTDPVTKQRVDPAGMTLVVTKPNGEVDDTAQVLRDDVGLYHLSIAFTEPNHWLISVTTVGRYQAGRPRRIMVYPT
jgi:hypothetical protein